MRIFLGVKENECSLEEMTSVLANKDVTLVVWPGSRKQKAPAMNLFPSDIGAPGDTYIHFSGYQKLEEDLLAAFGERAFNIHPAPPWRRGSGGLNHAIYDRDLEFGVTLHYINAEYDDGQIVHVYRFSILETENVVSAGRRLNRLRLEVLEEVVQAVYVGIENWFSNRSAAQGNSSWCGELKKIRDVDVQSNYNAVHDGIDGSELERRLAAFATDKFPVTVETRFGRYKIYSS